jgi:hypothetical protein
VRPDDIPEQIKTIKAPDSNPEDSEAGIRVLGTPFGSDKYQIQYANNTAVKAISKLKALSLLSDSTQLQLRLLRSCIIPLLNHLARTILPSFFLPAAKMFDQAVIDFLQGAFHMQGVTPRPWPYAAQLQSYLPYRLGGLALRSYTLHSPVIHFAAFEENLHNLSIIQSSFDVICSGFFQSVPDRERPLRLAIDNEYQLLLNLKAKSSSPLASDKREGVPIRRRQQLYCHLMDLYAVYPSLTGLFTNDVRDPSKSNPILRANLIRIIATQQPAACGFLLADTSTPELTIANDVMIVAVRRWLGLPIVPELLLNDGWACSCGANLTELHVQVCTQNYSTRDRHNNVMNALASFSRSVGLQVVCEEQVPGDTQKRYDASISNPSDPASSSVKVDVTIVSPIQSAYTHNIALNAKFTPMQAAEIAFKEKRKKYDPHSVNLPSGDVFLPFVMESFGSIHIEGRKFLAKLQHRARHFYSQAMMISNPTRLPLSVYYARILSTIVHVDSAHSILKTIRKAQVSIDNTAGRVPDSGT